MDMHPKILKAFWGLKVRGTIHAGAHMGEESKTYSRLGFGPVIWIEAIPRLATRLEEIVPPQDRVINATLWSSDGAKLTFKVTNSSGSSSLFSLGEHRVEYPNIAVEEELEVVTTTLDSLAIDGSSNLLVLDLQGAEHEAIGGGKRTLGSIDYVLAEVNRRELYLGIKLVPELDTLLQERGFSRVATRWTRHGWGEALYLRNPDSFLLARLWMTIKIFTFWLWLHGIEIPVVAIRLLVRNRV